ncbi:MAG: amino acid adenylation domain-containing protein, partial [Gemmatimonadetes bacterium]|nr:amino acid adenylation domain-containing protein [Gemmatimonadota bacterium]
AKGIGYGMLRYLGAEPVREALAAAVHPQVSFNYLGQYDQTFAGSRFAPSVGARGAECAPAGERRYLLEVDGGVLDGRLELTWTYGEGVHERATVERLADRYAGALRELIAHCRAPGAGGFTPSDFPLARIGQHRLDRMAAECAAAGAEMEELYTLSPLQQGILFHALYEAESGIYFEQVVLSLDGAVDAEALRRAWAAVTERHPVLRTSFAWEELDTPVQRVHRSVPVALDEHDWRGDSPDARLDAFLAADRETGFDLGRAPLQRLALIRTGEAEYRFVWSHHHILLDGWSVALVLREVLAAYAALVAGGVLAPARARPFHDYVAWLEALEPAPAEAFWRDALRGFTAPTPFSVDRAAGGPGGVGEAGGRIPAATVEALRALARRLQVTLNTVVQGAWGLLLARYSGEDDVVFGATVSGRPTELAGVEEMVGLFINSIPVRVRPRPDAALSGWLREVQAWMSGALEHQHTPLVQVQGWSEVPRGQPLFESLVVFAGFPTDAAGPGAGGGVTVRESRALEMTSYPLSLMVEPGDGLELHLQYRSDRFDAEVAGRLLGHFRVLLEGMAVEGDPRLSDLRTLTRAEWDEVVSGWNATDAAYPGDRCFHELVAERAAAAPDAVAVTAGDRRMTYRELEVAANRLARHLGGLGVRAESRVALSLERSPEMIVGMLGILKAGAAYVPLDPSYPRERLQYMLEDSDAHVVVTRGSLVAGLPVESMAVVCLDRDHEVLERESGAAPEVVVLPGNGAYVIYTSGSTGRPKGVLVSHRGMVHATVAQARAFGVRADDRVLQFVSFSFDASVSEIGPALLAGAALVLPVGEALLPGPDMARWLDEEGITILTLPPSALAALPSDTLRSVRMVVTGGEACAPDVVDRWATGRCFYNCYGPTEASIWATYARALPGEGRVTLGAPIDNARVYVLDPRMNPVPVGVPGELYIGGVGITRGYLNRAELTAERFVPDPFGGEAGARLYRTGDRTRWLATGEVEFLGRVDAQVKVRGFRIELGEVEAALSRCAGVREAAAVALQERTGPRLVAYLVPEAGKAPTVGAVRDALREALPEYMVPSAFVVMEEFPLTPNGKVDRRALPAPDALGLESGYVAPRTPTEEILAGVWSAVLGVERVGVHDGFLELGGHSLLATRMISRIRQALGVDLPVRALFEAATVARLAERAESARREIRRYPSLPLLRAPRDGTEGFPLSFAQERLWFVEQLEPGRAAYNIPHPVRLRGALDVDALRRALEEVVRRHESLRTVFRPVEGRAFQHVVAPSLTLAVDDLAGLPAEEREAEALRRTARDAALPFDLEAGPLFRASLLRVAPDDHLLLLCMHHVVSDGWSMGVLFRELEALYGAFRSGAASPLAEPEVQYADYAVWQREYLAGEVLDGQLAYWTERLAGAPGLLELPTDRPRPAVQSFRGALVHFRVPSSVVGPLKALSKTEGATLFMTLLAAWQLLLARYTGEDDVVVGSPIAGRTRGETEGMIGFFVNTLALRADLSGDPSFRELLARVRGETLGAYDHQDLPFERLVDELGVERDLSRSPLFQVMFALQNTSTGELALPGVEAAALERGETTSEFDLTLSLAEGEDGLAGVVEYATDLFDAATIERMMEHFRTLLEGVAAGADRRVSALPLLTDAARAELAALESAPAAAAIPSDRCVHELFEAQVERTPGAVAVLAGDEALTYAELNRRSNQLAHHLRARGIGPDARVGILMERSPEMVVAILGILKAGGAYVPLDPEYPAERLALMLEETAVPVLLTSGALADALPAHPAEVMRLDADWPRIALESETNPRVAVTPDNLLYVIYTSGSTGIPKGSEVPHRAIPGFFWGVDHVRYDAEQVLLQHSSTSWDGCTLELWPALLLGGRTVLYPGRTPEPAVLAGLIRRHGVTTLWLPAAFFNAIVDTDPGMLAGVRQLMVGGEALSPPHVRRAQELLPDTRIVNGYGPSECTVFTNCHVVPRDPETRAIPIGRPVGDRRVHVLDRWLDRVPVGVPGELYVGGP